jgi:hypothetical protein
MDINGVAYEYVQQDGSGGFAVYIKEGPNIVPDQHFFSFIVQPVDN